MTALLYPMNGHEVRMLDRLECVPNMSHLSTTFLAMPFPQALRGRPIVAIARRRFAAIAAILRNLIFQGLNAICQLL
jgi:hypothetical protein